MKHSKKKTWENEQERKCKWKAAEQKNVNRRERMWEITLRADKEEAEKQRKADNEEHTAQAWGSGVQQNGGDMMSMHHAAF